MEDKKIYIWDEEKNRKLKAERAISFEEIVYAIESGCLIDTLVHPNTDKYQNQRIHLVLIDSYVFVVPFVEQNEHIVLKTAFPSRKETRKYWEGAGNEI